MHFGRLKFVVDPFKICLVFNVLHWCMCYSDFSLFQDNHVAEIAAESHLTLEACRNRMSVELSNEELLHYPSLSEREFMFRELNGKGIHVQRIELDLFI